MDVSLLRRPSGKRLPLLMSAPHVGVAVPSELTDQFAPEPLAELRDTDWLVHELYAFAVGMGVTLLEAQISRYVVDLNRPAAGPSLYSDSRRQTDVIPLTDFDGTPLYLPGHQPDAAERQRRIALYYDPYHAALERELLDLQREFSDVILFDAHSIRRSVPSLDARPFPDLILGDRDGTSAASALSQAIVTTLRSSPYHVSHNNPFKGGQITRRWGQPDLGIHALQLEMSQDIYLADDDGSSRPRLSEEKVKKLKPWLEKALVALVEAVRKL